MHPLYLSLWRIYQDSLGIVIKQSSISAIFTYLGALFGFVNTVILFPAFLDVEQIGLIRVIPSTAFMLVPFAQLGLPMSLLKFFPEVQKKKDGLSEMITMAVFGVLIGFLLIGSLLWLFEKQIINYFADNSQLLNDYFYVVVVLVLILAIHTLFEVYSRIFLKIIIINIVKEVLIRLMLSMAVALYFLQYISFDHLVNALMVIYGLALIILLAYIYSIGQLKFTLRFKHLNKPLLRSIMKYALFVFIGSSSGNIVLNIDQIMVSSALSLSDNGIYTTAFYFAVMIELSRRAISQITTPLVSSSFEEKDVQSVKKIYQQVSINQMIIGSLFFIGIVVNLDRLFELMPNGDLYSAGKYVVYFIGLSKLFDMIFANNSEIIVMSNHYKINVVIVALLAIMVVVFNLLLIPQFGINGAALASLLAMLIYNLAKFIFIKLKLGFQPFTQKTIIQLFITGVTLFIGFIIPSFESPIIDIIIRSMAVSLIFGVLVYLLKVSAEITGIIDKVIGLGMNK